MSDERWPITEQEEKELKDLLLSFGRKLLLNNEDSEHAQTVVLEEMGKICQEVIEKELPNEIIDS